MRIFRQRGEHRRHRLPDVGSVKRARKVAEKFGVPIAIIDKRRPKANVMEVMNIIGDGERQRDAL